jgi:hypothetical protein
MFIHGPAVQFSSQRAQVNLNEMLLGVRGSLLSFSIKHAMCLAAVYENR